MAKKIRLDFSKVEERSGYNSRQMPEGLYEAKVTGLVHKDAQDGTAMLVYSLAPTADKYKTRNFPYYCKLQQNQLWKLRDLFVAAGETIPKKATQIDPEKIVGSIVAIEVGDDTGQYDDRSVIVSVYPTSILEESDDADDDDEDYDDDDDSDEEYEDDEDLDEDEDDDDYDDSDDEDEDDESDDEEDEEDEEDDEEEEPAPKRKAATRKPAAKKPSAEAAPAKRTVKRRR